MYASRVSLFWGTGGFLIKHVCPRTKVLDISPPLILFHVEGDSFGIFFMVCKISEIRLMKMNP